MNRIREVSLVKDFYNGKEVAHFNLVNKCSVTRKVECEMGIYRFIVELGGKTNKQKNRNRQKR